jgi:hypothetical protein
MRAIAEILDRPDGLLSWLPPRRAAKPLLLAE